MKIIDLLTEEKLTLSFEVFPPKTESAFDSVKHATEEIAKLNPAFMSVTYGAGGGTSKYTLDIAKNIDIFTYSFPCQDLSNQGKQKGMNKNSGTRSGLL